MDMASEDMNKINQDKSQAKAAYMPQECTLS
jgi:hypothetical protein